MAREGWTILIIVTLFLIILDVLISYLMGVRFYVNFLMIVGYALFISRLIRHYS